MSAHVLVADDDARWRRIVGDFLRNEGYLVSEAADGAETVEAVRSDGDIDLVVLDIMMPGVDGMEACRQIRTFSDVPILMVTARTDEESELTGFQCGADDYVSKPIKFPILIARTKALLKRTGFPSGTITAGGIEISPEAHTVRVSGEQISLTSREFELLLYLAQNRNVALSRQQILEAVWACDFYGDARTVDTHIKNLRMKLGPAGAALKTVRDRGYKLEEEA